MKKSLLILIISLCVNVCCAQEKNTTDNETDILNISKLQSEIDKNGLPTTFIVDKMETKADSLYALKKYEESIAALETFAKNANWLSNLMAQSLRPYYSASYENKQKIGYAFIKNFIPIEEKVNQYRKARNRAYLRIGLCYKILGNNTQAVAYLHKALDLISTDESEDWIMAKNALLEILQFSPNVSSKK